MFQSILSVVVGYLVMAIIVMIGTIAAAAALVPGGLSALRGAQSPPTPSKNYLYANYVLSFAAAVVGGWLTARMAPSAPVLHAIVLSILILGMSVISERTQKAKAALQPSWYPRIIAVIAVAGVLIGGAWETGSMMG